MPIYEYQCAECGERFEVRQSFGDDGSKVSCPKCKAENPKRLISSFFSPNASDSDMPDLSCPSCSSGTCGLPPM
ncbi:MAG: FmdB family zinc ribbon protein [Chloroflexota bacterium]